MLKHILTIFIGLVSSSAYTQKLPNIVILYGDDLGYGDLQCYNKNSKIPTPNLDKLASEGMLFTDGHSSSGICTPSRYALLTGRHHWRKFHGIVNALGNSAFDKERLTLPEMLKEKGYHTGAIGKWHLGWDWDALRIKNPPSKVKNHFSAFDWNQAVPNGPLDHGFDYYFGDTVINFPPYAWIENDKLVKAPDAMMDSKKWKKIKEGNWECRPGPMVSDWNPYDNIPATTAKGVDYIKQQAKSDKPFFLYFAYPSPHAPIIPNDQFDGKSGAGPYGDFVHETDDSIGQLLTAIKESGEAENTLVIFSADNGPEKYAYARTDKYDHWSPYPLRGLKRDIYEGGHRVPFIIKWPGKVAAGKRSDALISQIDIMATIAAIVDYKLPDQQAEDSHNMLPLITDKSNKGPRTVHIHNTFANAYAIRENDWLLLDAKSGYHSKVAKGWEEKNGYKKEPESGQLYNLKDDLSQKKNLIDQYPEKVTAMKAKLKKIREQGYSAPRFNK